MAQDDARLSGRHRYDAAIGFYVFEANEDGSPMREYDSSALVGRVGAFEYAREVTAQCKVCMRPRWT